MVAPHALDNRWPHRGGRLGDASIRCNGLAFPLHDHHYDLDTGISRHDPLNPSERVMRCEGLRGAVRAEPAASRAGIPSLVSCPLGINDQPTPGSTVSPAYGTSTATYLLIPACWPTGPVLASRSQRANALSTSKSVRSKRSTTVIAPGWVYGSRVRRKTKIVATLGPAVDSEDQIRALIEAGLNVARFNFSHGDHDSHRRRFAWVREVAEDLDLPVATLQDIQGPKMRVGTFPEGQVHLEPDSMVDLIPGEGLGSVDRVHIAHLDSVVLEPGAPVLLSDGIITLECVEVGTAGCRARVVEGGELLDHRGAAFPGSQNAAPVVTEKDKKDLAFGQELGFDLVAASFISSAADIREIRSHIATTAIIAKIESARGYRNLDDILTAADGAMVARGDLGVELSLEHVPRAQSDILARTNAAGKLSITATEMLESMVTNPRPTRAEVSDVYLSVLEDTDAVMLSAETAIGAYPVRAVMAMDVICREAESSPDFGKAPEASSLTDRAPFASAVAQAAVDTSNRLGLDSIVAFTETGSTARLLSKYRPHADIYAYTTHDSTYRRMALYGGVTPLPSPPHESTDSMLSFVETDLQKRGIAQGADAVVMVAGTPPNIRATTNLMKLHRIGATTAGNPEH